VQGKGLPGSGAVTHANFLEIHKPEQLILKPLSIIVGAGEAEAIALAQTTPDSCVLLG